MSCDTFSADELSGGSKRAATRSLKPCPHLANFPPHYRATTHWRYAGILQTQFPKVRVDVARILIRRVIVGTAAEMTAGMDFAPVLIGDAFDTRLPNALAKSNCIGACTNFEPVSKAPLRAKHLGYCRQGAL